MNQNQLTATTAKNLSAGEKGPTLTIEDLSREDFVRYAGASGDFNPLHYDESYANGAGHPDVFAQGMLIAGIASRFVTDWIGVETLTRFRTRFTAQVWPEDTLTVTGEVTDKITNNSEIKLEIRFNVFNQEDTVVLAGDATAVFPDSD